MYPPRAKMKCLGKVIPVLIEVIPDVFVDQHQVPAVRKRYPRPWRPRLRSRKYKKNETPN
jgi:hypothetical protein